MVTPSGEQVVLPRLIAALNDHELPGGPTPVLLELEQEHLRIRTEAGTELGGHTRNVGTIRRLLRVASSHVATIPPQLLWSQSQRIKVLEVLRLIGEVAEKHNYPWFKEERP